MDVRVVLRRRSSQAEPSHRVAACRPRRFTTILNPRQILVFPPWQDVRFGSEAHIRTAKSDICFIPESELLAACPLSARSGQDRHNYSIISSAIESTPDGMVSPSALAVLRLMTSSNLASWMIGRSPGFSPLRILPA